MGETPGRAIKKIGKFFAFIVFAIFLFVLRVHAANAASLYFSPSSGSYASGASFTVGVYVSSGEGVSANAFSGVVSFPADKLEVTGVSKSGSIMSLWVADPSYSNSSGTVNFDGIVLNPGYTGSSGKIASITFKAKSAGSAAVSFSSGSVLANDGSGTDILSSRGTGTYTIGGTETTPPETPQPVTAPPGAPRVSSSTHPNSDAWYGSNDVAFSWSLPSTVTGVNVLADRNANTDPGTTSDGLISRYTYSDVDDGVWYFHIKLQNEKGWGATAHFKFQVDTVAPTAFAVSLSQTGVITAEAPTIIFNSLSSDALSGLDHYSVKIDGAEVAKIDTATITKGSTYTLPKETSGTKTLVVEAVDRAGNTVSAVPLTFTLEAPAAPIEQPVVAPQASSFEPFLSDALNVLIHAILYVLLGLLGIFLLIASVFTVFMLQKHIRADWALYWKHRQKTHPKVIKDLRRLQGDIHALSRKLEAIDREVERQIGKLS